MTLPLAVLVGPTASGKTRIGVAAAHALGGDILSADARQVYRGLDIGSGKDRREYAAVDPPVPVHGIDVCDPAAVYSLFRFQRDAYRLFADRAARDDAAPLLVVGGSGLWVEAVLAGYRIPDVPEDPAFRAANMDRSREDLAAELYALDPERHAATDRSTRKRLVRALEIARHARTHGLAVSPPCPVPLEARVLALDVPRDTLHDNIDRRLDARLAAGLVEEVESLLAAGLPPARLDQLGLEYREAGAYLAGRVTHAGMVDSLRRGIRRFAKRQVTRFRGFPRRGIPLRWVPPDEAEAALVAAWREAAGA